MGYVLEIDWMKKLSQQEKEPRNCQQEKKCIKKLHGFCCDTKFKKSISGVSKRITLKEYASLIYTVNYLFWRVGGGLEESWEN